MFGFNIVSTILLKFIVCVYGARLGYAIFKQNYKPYFMVFVSISMCYQFFFNEMRGKGDFAMNIYFEFT